ncbi:MAG: hypothetical protein ABL890_05035 [Candidatus Peribacteraceae bacterium]
MAKRPTPKKRLSKDRGRRRHSVYVKRENVRLTNFAQSPYSALATKKNASGRAMKKVTKVKA